jgi:hypothetical protein
MEEREQKGREKKTSNLQVLDIGQTLPFFVLIMFI